MATQYLADTYGKSLRVASDADDFTQPFLFTVPAAGFIINDTVLLCPIPLGTIVLEWMVDVPALDSGTTVRIELGDTASATRFMAATLAGGSSAGSIIYSQANGQLGILPRSYTAVDNFILTVSTAAAATTTTGSFRGWVRFNMIGVPPSV